MTEWPETETATFCPLAPVDWSSLEMASTTRERVHDRAVHDRLRGEGLEARPHELVGAFFSLAKLHQLDGRRTDIEPYEVLGFPEQHGSAALPPQTSEAINVCRQSSERYFPPPPSGSVKFLGIHDFACIALPRSV